MQPLISSVEQAQSEGLLMPSAAENLIVWLRSEFLPQWARESLRELITESQWTELNDRFYQNLSFGTGGMRSRTIAKLPTKAEIGTGTAEAPEHTAVGSNTLNDFNVVKATIGLYHYCTNSMDTFFDHWEVPKLVIAHDVRFFSRHFCELVAATWQQLGGQAYIFDGPRSTPQLSFTIRHIKADAGVVITASHNPSHDNGFKAYFRDGAQMVSPHDQRVVEAYNRVPNETMGEFLRKTALPKVTTLSLLIDDAYIQALDDIVIDKDILATHPPKVAYSAIHGTGGLITVPLLRKYGVDVISVGDQMHMDPRFPTVTSPNPENKEALALVVQQAIKSEAEAALATDPDGDRMAVAILDGQRPIYLSGNLIGSILAEYRLTRMQELGWIPQNGSSSVAIIKTFVTTPLQSAIAQRHGVKCIDTLTGFKWIGEKLMEYEAVLHKQLRGKEGIALDYNRTVHAKRVELLQKHSTFYAFGGEESYGYLASDRVRDKDANAACLMICEWLAFLKKNYMTPLQYIDQLYLKYGYYTEDQLNIVCEGAKGMRKIKNILASYRTRPPHKIGNAQVSRFVDFGKETVCDADNKVIPKQDFYFLYLDNGYSYAVRGSGTEPKLKFYLFAHEHVVDSESLSHARDEAVKKIEALKEALKADAERRSEEF